ncbi:MAG: hypothetical protein LBT10_05100 [Methanobrevibacter sp.]|jgi:hypothetical protein|nr:hypothetical protein [Methanobrevibacter sp.]
MVLFISLLLNREDIKKLLLSLSAVLLSFLPWVPVIRHQISNGWASWIPSPDLDDLLKSLYYIFSPNNEFSIIGIIFIISILSLFLYHLKVEIIKKSFRNISIQKEDFLILGVLVFMMILILSVISSNLMVSSFLPRYMFLALGILYLSFTYLLTKTYSKKIIFVPILIVLILNSTASTSIFLEDKKDDIIVNNQYTSFIDDINPNQTMIITTNSGNYFAISTSKQYDKIKNIVHYVGNDYNKKEYVIDRFKRTDLKPYESFIDFIKRIEDIKIIYIYTWNDVINNEEFVDLLNKNGYDLVKFKELNKTNDYYMKDVYPVFIYQIVEKNI